LLKGVLNFLTAFNNASTFKRKQLIWRHIVNGDTTGGEAVRERKPAFHTGDDCTRASEVLMIAPPIRSPYI
jgi:hypothetical protein